MKYEHINYVKYTREKKEERETEGAGEGRRFWSSSVCLEIIAIAVCKVVQNVNWYVAW